MSILHKTCPVACVCGTAGNDFNPRSSAKTSNWPSKSESLDVADMKSGAWNLFWKINCWDKGWDCDSCASFHKPWFRSLKYDWNVSLSNVLNIWCDTITQCKMTSIEAVESWNNETPFILSICYKPSQTQSALETCFVGSYLESTTIHSTDIKVADEANVGWTESASVGRYLTR